MTLISYWVVLGIMVGAQQLMPVTVFAFLKPWQAEISFRAVMAFSIWLIFLGGALVALLRGLIKTVSRKLEWNSIRKASDELGFGLALSTAVFLTMGVFLLSVEKIPVLEKEKLLGAVLMSSLVLIILTTFVFYGAWKYYEKWIEKYARITILGLGGLVVLLTTTLFGVKLIGDRWPIKAEKSDKPSVIWVTVDALRHDRFTLEYMPQTYQWFEEEGYIFENAMAPAPWTVPSFASMVTGEYPSQMRADLPMNEQEKNFEVLPEKITIAEEFKDLGYSTAAVVTNGWLNERRGFDQGFDYFVNLEATNVYDWGKVTHDSGFYKLSEAIGWENKLKNWYQGLVRVRSTESAFEIDGEVVVNEALKVRERLQEPYFLWIHLIDPHGPYIPPIEFYPNTAGYTGDEVYKAEHMVDREASDKLRELTVTFYDQLVAYTDQQLYRLFSELEKSDESMVIVFNSDHGEQFWENDGEIGHGHNLYAENVHVPMAIATDGDWEWKEESEDLVDLKEIKNIMLSIAEIEEVDFLGEDKMVFVEGRIEGPGQQAVINPDTWKLITKKGAEELYILLFDPKEMMNLRAVRRYLGGRLSGQIEDWQSGMQQKRKEYARKLEQRHGGESLPDVAGY